MPKHLSNDEKVEKNNLYLKRRELKRKIYALEEELYELDRSIFELTGVDPKTSFSSRFTSKEGTSKFK